VSTGPFKYDPDNSRGWQVRVYDPNNGDPVIINGKHRREPLLRWFGKDLKNRGILKFPTQSDLEAILQLVPYDSPDWFQHEADENPSFRNILEGWHEVPPVKLHNCIRVWVGGTMQSGYSPADPIFFLNHWNVDRIWAEWQARDPKNPDRGYPPNGTVTRLDGSLIQGNNRSDKMFPWDKGRKGNPTIESFLNHRVLGYRYDTEKP
jgi:tyrosinase